ncbi:MAG TPA: universal stress protein [Casimicrobiaceae bacterium]
MSLKSILVHIDDVEASKPRLAAAIRLAREHGAQLVGIHLVPLVELNSAVAAMIPPELIERRGRENLEAQRAAEAMFRSETSAAGLRAIAWRAPPGLPVDAAVVHARCTDLFVVGQRNPPDLLPAEDLVTSVLLASGRPLLVVPYIGARPTLGERVLVAWDGGREASRAIADAMPLLERAKRVDVIAVNRDAGATSDATAAGTRLADWLHQHGIAADVSHQAAPDISIGEWLLSRAADLGSDLIVMGGYGHTRMRELILGGVTRTMLQAMTVPVLMAH